MAKINLTTQHNQENLSALASLGVLICMIVSLVAIKLWWFKHRLSFEQKNTPTNSASSGTTPAVIVPRRSKQQKYKKDKRYSQQIYETVQVHGVFRQKLEDDLEIQRPVQLPPVRIRQTSESASSLILPPPRTKRRDQVHSTAFEDLEIATPPTLVTASSSDLSAIPEFNTKITLTFEEFERQFKLKEIKPELPQHTLTNNEVIEKPVPPLRLNRSSSTLTKPEKPQRLLKSSQSITIPEFHHKVVEKKSVGFSSPKEDLSKIDFYEKTKIFENFGDPKAAVTAGYIKYEEVDNDLHERELNTAEDKFMDNGFCERPQMEAALKALRNERVIYNNNLNESPEIHLTEEYNFANGSFKINEWQVKDFKEDNFIERTSKAKEITNKFELKDSINNGNNEFQSINTSRQNKFKKESANFENIAIESETFKEGTTSENDNNLSNEQRPNRSFQDFHNVNQITSIKKEEPKNFKEDFTTEFQISTEPQNSNAPSFGQSKQISNIKIIHSNEIANSMVKNNGLIAADNETTKELHSTNDLLTNEKYVDQNLSVEAKKSQNPFTLKSDNASLASFEEEFENWPQFEEKIVTPQVTIRKFNNHDLEAQSSFDENDDLNSKYQQENSFVDSNSKENGYKYQKKFSARERRPTGYPRERTESPEFHDIEEWQESFNNKFYNQVRTFITAESSTNLDGRGVSFDYLVEQQIVNKNSQDSTIKQRRPTGYTRRDEYCVTFSDESDEEFKNTLQFNRVVNESQLSKVKFEDSISGSDNETEKFTLNQRRPTGFVRPLDTNESDGMSESHVKFDKTTVFKDAKEIEISIIKQRRPTGFVKKLDILDLSDDETFKGMFKKENGHATNDLENQEVSKNSPSVGILESESSEIDFEINTESLVKQREPTEYQRQEFFTDSSNVSFLKTEDSEKNIESLFFRPFENVPEELSSPSPTVGFLETEKGFENSETNIETLIKQRRPTGYVREEISSHFPTTEFLATDKGFDDSETKTESLAEHPKYNGRRRNSSDSPIVRFLESEKRSEDCELNTESLIKQRRPTGYVRQEASPDSPSAKILEAEKSFENYETESLVKQRRPTGYVSHNSSTMTVDTEKRPEDYETNPDSLVKQRRPTGYVQQEHICELEKQVSFQLNNENNEKRLPNEALQQRRPTGFVKKEETNKHVYFQLNQNYQADEKIEYENEQLKQRRPTGFVRKKELLCLNQPAPIYQTSSEENNNQYFDDHLWQELEKDVAEDFSNNFEEEFAKIRHSYEINEADFLELKDEFQKSPTEVLNQPLGFGKTIEDDWENFEKLKSQIVIKPLPPSPEEKIKITFSENDLANTTSILKDTKLEEDIQPKPRKSKVTFDFKTEEHEIPARKIHNYSEEETDKDDNDGYDKQPTPVPPKPVKRVSNINYNNEPSLTPLVAIPTSLTFFGSQISTADNDVEDSWSAIRKHRSMTGKLQNLSSNSSQTAQPNNMPPKPTYRNPMAQLAIQRAKEVRADMDRFKSRTINNRKPEASRRRKQKLLNLSNVDYEGGTEA